jgi:fumarate hydratase class II
MVCAQVIGYDAAIAWCGAGGHLELNVMMPLMAYDLLESEEILAAASRNFADRLVEGLTADRERIGEIVERSLAMATALAPEIGYDRTAAIVKEAHQSNRSLREVAKEKSGLTDKRLAELMDPRKQSGAG